MNLNNIIPVRDISEENDENRCVDRVLSRSWLHKFYRQVARSRKFGYSSYGRNILTKGHCASY